jgi:hypothetical protein
MGDSCGRKVLGQNPRWTGVFGPGDFVIPSRTPFTLTCTDGWDDDRRRLTLATGKNLTWVIPIPPLLGEPERDDQGAAALSLTQMGLRIANGALFLN